MKSLVVFLVLFFAVSGYCGQSAETWNDLSSGIDEVNMKIIAAAPQDPNIIYACSDKNIFKSGDAGRTWQKLSSVHGAFTSLNALSISPDNPSVIYAGTGSGLFRSADAGAAWRNITEGIGAKAMEITHLALAPGNANRIYLGTASGLFITSDSGNSWNRPSGEIASRAINFIAVNPADNNTVYVASRSGIFRSGDSGMSWSRVFVASDQFEGAESEEALSAADTDEIPTSSDKTPNCIAFDGNNMDRLYAGTNSGAFLLADNGRTVVKLTDAGLTNKKITSLVSTNDGAIYASTADGVFRILKPYDRWEDIYAGLASKDVRWLAYAQQNNMILAAARKGIYKIGLTASPDASAKGVMEADGILRKFESEPTIREVQDAAIKYAEVHKEKIDEWRKSAKRKALLPTLSVGVDHDIRSSSEIYTSASQNYIVNGPDDSTTGWDARVSWDLGDLIWNDDQANIDVRSRLMVQLRDDILNEVTKLYFERRRLQIEMLTNPPKNTQLKLEKELRLQELTAGIDALTGGYLTKRLISDGIV